MNLVKEQIEQGSASIIIELHNGDIVVKHGTDKSILKKIDNVKYGSWSKIWKTLNMIQSVNN
jgi:hypothetical protein